jgi:hypothetical protein
MNPIGQHIVKLPTATAVLFGAPFFDTLADYNTTARRYYATEQTPEGLRSFQVGANYPLEARPDLLFIEAVRAYFDTNFGDYLWQDTNDPWSQADFDRLRLEGASTSDAMFGAGLSDAKVARRAAGEAAAYAVIDAGRFDTVAGRPFDAAKRREMAHRAGLSNADTERLTTPRIRPGALNLTTIFGPSPKLSRGTQQHAIDLLSRRSPFAVRSLPTGPAPHPAAVLGSGALFGVAGYFLAPAEYRLPAAAGAAIAGLLLTRFVH